MQEPEHSQPLTTSSTSPEYRTQPATSQGLASSTAVSGGLKTPRAVAGDLTRYLETGSDTVRSHAAACDVAPPPVAPVTIPEENVINITDALVLAAAEGYPMGKATLQRYAKTWREMGHAAPVKSIMPISPSGSIQLLDREDLLSWIFNAQSTPRRGTTPPATARDDVRSPEISETHQASVETGRGASIDHTDKYVSQLERETEMLREQIMIKDQQVSTQSRTIDTLLDRSKETNVLFQTLQALLGKVIGIELPQLSNALATDQPRQLTTRPPGPRA